MIFEETGDDGESTVQNTYPSKLITFVKITDDLNREQIQAIVHCAGKKVERENSVLTEKWNLEMTSRYERQFQRVDVDTFNGLTYVVPDVLPNDDGDEPISRVNVVKPYEEWEGEFVSF